MTRRERWLVGGIGGTVVALIAVGIVVALLSGTPATRRGCVSVGLAYSTGGELIHRCGAAARALCRGVGHPGGITGAPADRVAAECRRAGLRVG